MEWTSDNDAEIYTFTQGPCAAKVWYSAVDHWCGSVSRVGVSIGQRSFTTIQDAQAWCEAQLAAFVADGHCAADAGAPPL